MRTDKLTEAFRALCAARKNHPDVLFCEFTEEKMATVFTLYFRAVKIQLVYCRRWEVLAPPSVLFSRICFSKAERGFIHLPELIAYLGRDDYRACYFPYLETPERMEAAFHALWTILEDYIPIAESIAITGECDELIRKSNWENFFDDQAEPEPVPEDEVLIRHMMEDIGLSFEGLMVGRHTNLDAYEAFLLGKWDTALRKYRKMEKSGLSTYERGLCRFMADPANRGFVPMPPECSAVSLHKTHQQGLHELWGILLFWIPLSCLTCGILAVSDWYLSRGALYSFGVPLWFGLIAAAIPALLGYAAFQRKSLELLKQKKALQFFEMTEHRHPMMNRIIRLLFAVTLILSLGFSFWISRQRDLFYEGHAVHISEEGITTEFSYSEIESIYYINSRHNVYGGRVERGSYVIVLQDGSRFDLDGNLFESEQEMLIDALFSDFQIITVDSDLELP